jgi:nucleoside-diphosphate-sugar epimerase
MERKVLVTGASGLLGLEICKQLADEFYVVAVDSGFRSHETPHCNEFIQQDVNTYVSYVTNDFDYIFHMGNINGTKYFYNIPNKLIENNIKSDFSIFKFAGLNPNCKLIYASSSEVVAGTDTYPTPELNNILINDIHNPRWSYRLGKLVGENYLTNSNLNYLIIRFFNIFGKYSSSGHFVKDIVDKIKDKDYSLIGANETRSFCHVEDAVDAVLKIKEVSNTIVNVGSNEEISILEAANLIGKHLGIDNINWTFEQSVKGSVVRRKPDLTKLLKHYPQYSPKKFKDAIQDL